MLGSFAYIPLSQVLVLGVFFTGVYYFSLYDDGSNLKKQIQDVETQVQTVEQNIAQAGKELRDLTLFKDEIQKQEQFIKAFINFIPSSLTFTDISVLVIQQARLAGVNISSKRDVQFKQYKDTDYEFLTMQLEVIGSFSQLMFFLSKLTEQKRILIVNEINISMAENKIVRANINLIAFRYKKAEESSQG